MGGISSSISDKLIGRAPIERVVAAYPDPKKFFDEMNNYLIGGLVVSCSKFFMMVKPIESNKDPSGQWWPKNPDCWYARWVAGEGALKAMFDVLTPLPNVMFRRIKPGGESGLRIYNWERMYGKMI